MCDLYLYVQHVCKQRLEVITAGIRLIILLKCLLSRPYRARFSPSSTIWGCPTHMSITTCLGHMILLSPKLTAAGTRGSTLHIVDWIIVSVLAKETGRRDNADGRMHAPLLPHPPFSSLPPLSLLSHFSLTPLSPFRFPSLFLGRKEGEGKDGRIWKSGL